MKPLPHGYFLRRLRPTDEKNLIDFFHSHSPETVYLRYGYRIADMSHERALRLVSVDQRREVALGIFQRAPGHENLHAIGRYCAEPDGKTVEVAFVVRESKRRLGFATQLLHGLAVIARENGYSRMHAYVLPENHAMREFIRAHAHSAVHQHYDDLWEYTVDLASLLGPMPSSTEAAR